jgi:hypothetical protein
MLSRVAWATQGLNVVDGVRATHRDWKNVVDGQFHVFLSTAETSVAIEIENRFPFFDC